MNPQIINYLLVERKSAQEIWENGFVNRENYENKEDFYKQVRAACEVILKFANQVFENRASVLQTLKYSGNKPSILATQKQVKQLISKLESNGITDWESRSIPYVKPQMNKIEIDGVLLPSSPIKDPRDKNRVYEDVRASIIIHDNSLPPKQIEPPTTNKSIRRRQYIKKSGPSSNNKYFVRDRGPSTHDESIQQGKAEASNFRNSIQQTLNEMGF